MEETLAHGTLKHLPTDVLQRIEHLADTITVCVGKGYHIPDGWVIIAETVLPELPGKWPNGWMIKKPEETEIVCAVSPIPENYVKIEHMGSEVCPGPWPNAWKIERLVSSTDE